MKIYNLYLGVLSLIVLSFLQSCDTSKVTPVAITDATTKQAIADFLKGHLSHEYDLLVSDNASKNNKSAEAMKSNFADAKVAEKRIEAVKGRRENLKSYLDGRMLYKSYTLKLEGKDVEVEQEGDLYKVKAVVYNELPTTSTNDEGEQVITKGYEGYSFTLEKSNKGFSVLSHERQEEQVIETALPLGVRLLPFLWIIVLISSVFLIIRIIGRRR